MSGQGRGRPKGWGTRETAQNRVFDVERLCACGTFRGTAQGPEPKGCQSMAIAMTSTINNWCSCNTTFCPETTQKAGHFPLKAHQTIAKRLLTGGNTCNGNSKNQRCTWVHGLCS